MFKMTNLKSDELKAVQELEEQLKSRLGEDIALIAWKDEDKDKTKDTHKESHM
jgi:hypothetical protein